jgi:hypothetical protein
MLPVFVSGNRKLRVPFTSILISNRSEMLFIPFGIIQKHN